MKLIQLSQGQVAQVDDKNFDWLNQWKWCAQWAKNTQSFYAMRREGYQDAFGLPRRRTVIMHRLIMDTPKGMMVDHIDHATLNNQESNLRNCTQSQNMMNRRGATSQNKSTGVLGVSPHGSGFNAHISVKKKRLWSKTFRTAEEAAAWRQAAELLHYADFAGESK